jgi:branched-subunit amino acid transport protein
MSAVYVWTVILGLGVFTYLIRFSFLGLVGDRAPSPFAARLLRYVPAAVLPALVAPMVVLDRETGGLTEPHAWLAALAAVAVGAISRNLVATIVAGMAAFHLLRWLGV